MIRKCDCKHEGQDAIHGVGMRVKNPSKDGDKFICTVCGQDEAKVSLKKDKKK